MKTLSPPPRRSPILHPSPRPSEIMTSDGRGEVGWGGRRSASGSTLRWPVSDPGDSRLRPGPCEAGASVGAPSQAVPGRFREALPDPGRAARRGPPQTLEEVAAHTRQRSCRREAQNPDRVRRQTSPLGLPPHETPAASRFAPRQSIRVASEVFACPAPDGRMTPAARVPAAAPLWVGPLWLAPAFGPVVPSITMSFPRKRESPFWGCHRWRRKAGLANSRETELPACAGMTWGEWRGMTPREGE
jgi:hypothetical protein